MTLITYRYKVEPSAGKYAALRTARWHCKDFRNACLEERRSAYALAKRSAEKGGRAKPEAADWINARQHEIADFLLWQEAHEPDLRRRHTQADARRIAKSLKDFDAGRTYGPPDLKPRAWRPRDATSFGRGITLHDQTRVLAEIRAVDRLGIGHVPLSVLREHATIVDEAMTAFFKRVAKGQTPGFPRFKGFDQVTTLECPFGDGISFERVTTAEDGSVIACRLKSMMWPGGLRINMHRPMLAKPKRVSLSYDGRFWWASFLVEVEDVYLLHALPGTVAGCDVGVNRLVTLDDGSFYENPRFLRAGAAEVKAASRRLSKAKPGSSARRKARRSLATAHRRVRHRRETWRHTLSKRLARTAETLVFEGLNHKGMMASASGTVDQPGVNVAQKRGLNRSLSDTALSAIVKETRRKAESAGGRVLLVDPRNSSLECSRCHAIVVKEVYDLHDCPHCGLKLHRDHNAAIVLRDRGLDVLGGSHRPRRGARSTGAPGDAGRHRPPAPERKGKQRRDDVANLAASGESRLTV